MLRSLDLHDNGWLWSRSDSGRVSKRPRKPKSAKRPGLERARAMLASGEASTLIVAKMDRLSRSLLDFASIMQDAQAPGLAPARARRAR